MKALYKVAFTSLEAKELKKLLERAIEDMNYDVADIDFWRDILDKLDTAILKV